MRVVQYTQNESTCLRMDWIQLTGTHMSQETWKNTHRLVPTSHILIVQVEVVKFSILSRQPTAGQKA